MHPLTTPERMRLTSLYFDGLDNQDPPHQALLNLRQPTGQTWGQWLLIDFTHHPLDDFEWQAQELAFNRQLPDDFEWETTTEITRSNKAHIISEALTCYADWLKAHQHSVLTLADAQHNVTSAFILPNTAIAEFQSLAQTLGFKYHIINKSAALAC